MAVDNPGDRLRTQLEALAGRTYPEEGIPMFLVCEDLVANERAHPQRPASELNGKLARELRRDAEAWARLRPDAIEKDAAKIVEKIAIRDFASGGLKEDL